LIVRFTRRAENDLAAIIDFLIARSPTGARSVAASLSEAIRGIGEQPLSGHKTSNPVVLVKIAPRYPYKIFYRRRGDAIDILHIRHSARRPWLG
jgi:toxin ParE1/3/4